MGTWNSNWDEDDGTKVYTVLSKAQIVTQTSRYPIHNPTHGHPTGVETMTDPSRRRRRQPRWCHPQGHPMRRTTTGIHAVNLRGETKKGYIVAPLFPNPPHGKEHPRQKTT